MGPPTGGGLGFPGLTRHGAVALSGSSPALGGSKSSAIHSMRLMQKHTTYKAWFKRPILNAAGHCGTGKLCPCFGSAEELHDFGSDVEIFDLNEDPMEDNPLNNSHEYYEEVKHIFLNEYGRLVPDFGHPNENDAESYHNSDEVNLPSQFSHFYDVMPRPWMQPCARFPFCSTK